MEQTAKEFVEYVKRIDTLSRILATISFDNEIFAPEGGLETRSKRMSFLQVELFEMQTGDKMKVFLEVLSPIKNSLDKVTAAMVRNAQEVYDKNMKIPKELIKEFSEAQSKAFVAWQKARKENKFSQFAPHLKGLVEMQKKMLEFRANSNENAYEILLDDFEKGTTIEIYDKLFGEYKEVAIPLLKKIESKKKLETRYINEHVSLEAQEKISEFIATKLGYDLNCGLIEVAAHPFCSSIDKFDTRITTRYDEKDFLSSLYSVAHEVGHGIYEQNTADELVGTTLDDGISMGIHESQSRFYENMIGRSYEFWEHITDELKTYLPEKFQNLTVKQFYEAANKAEASLIRVEADELTYGIHILIRYEMEKMIFTENIDINDLPAIWNKKYEEYLGITPPTDSDGIMQDVHWAYGLFGYFPTYFLGSAYAAQFFTKKEGIEELIKKGDFKTITDWLTEGIHKHGSVYEPEELVQNFIGEQLDVKYYTDYLTKKFTEVYDL